MKSENVCGITAIMQETGMRRKDIYVHIESGKIKAHKRGKLLAFDFSEKERLASLCNMYVGFFSLVQKYTEDQARFSLKKQICRNELIAFMTNNSWFGVESLPICEVFFVNTSGETHFVRKSDTHLMESRLRLWLLSYGESAEGKLRLLLGRLCEIYPTTGSLLNAFIAERNLHDYTEAWILADFLCSTLTDEITMTDDNFLDLLAARVDNELPLNAANMFSAFIMHLRNKRKIDNGWSYHFQSRSTKEKSAYPTMSYIKMAYIVFNENAWEDEGLLKKALNSQSCANLWLFVALHFVCAWRSTDIVRLPMPALAIDGDAIREQIRNGVYNGSSLLGEVEMRLHYTPMKPNKTKDFNVPELKLFIAESLRKPLGIILAIAASYHRNIKPGETFIRRAGTYAELHNFFGENFVTACENKGFSTRRANKSYLQGIEASAGNTPGKPKGYMLAAIARSHKSGYGALPKTTEIYLRDARFSGYRPEFIAREMFERGIFSFIPALLLDMYEGEKYEKLSVSAQTSLIAKVGISPYGLEKITSSVQLALANSRRAIATILERPTEMCESVEDILQNIASGNAPGRQDGFLCLMTAAGFSCADVNRSCCIGCGYEIYTKTILRLLLSEYTRIKSKKRTVDKSEAARCDALIKKAILPALSEMLLAAERMYPDTDLKPLLEELKGGLPHVDR